MADILLIMRLRERRDIRNSWRLRDLQDPFQLPENVFIQRFRLSRAVVRNLIEDLKPHLKTGLNGYSIEMQVLTALRVIASGSFQNVVADGVLMQFSQASVSRFVRRVTCAISVIAKKYITFPVGAADVLEGCRNFHEKFGFPNVLGAIDCTHVYILKPSCSDWFSYINRKSRFSINVQMVCDSNMKIIDVVARWPGSTHDSHIWNFSGLRHLLSSGLIPQRAFLLGDSGYPLEPWLLTPYLNACSPSEEIFNVKHRHTRNIIERCFGLLKSRFRLLDESGGKILYNAPVTCQLIIAAAVLHNICIQANIEDPQPFYESGSSDDDFSTNVPPSTNLQARILRDEIAARFQAAR